MVGTKLFIALGSCVLFVTNASRAAGAERFEIGLFGGWSLLSINALQSPEGALPFEIKLDQNFLVGARFGYRVRPSLTVEGSYRYSPNGRFAVAFLTGDFIFDPELVSPSHKGSHAFSGNVVKELGEARRLHPFVVGGMGVERFGEGASSLRWSAGAGAIWNLRPKLRMRVDTEYILWKDLLSTGVSADGVEIHASLVVGL
jgi:hypothetical protein